MSRLLMPPTQREHEAMLAEIERLRALLNDKTYIQCKADYNKGHLSHGNYLGERERGLGLTDEQKGKDNG